MLRASSSALAFGHFRMLKSATAQLAKGTRRKCAQLCTVGANFLAVSRLLQQILRPVKRAAWARPQTHCNAVSNGDPTDAGWDGSSGRMEYGSKHFIPDTRRVKKSCDVRHRFVRHRHIANGTLLIVERSLAVGKRCTYEKRNRRLALLHLRSAYLKGRQALVGLMHS